MPPPGPTGCAATPAAPAPLSANPINTSLLETSIANSPVVRHETHRTTAADRMSCIDLEQPTCDWQSPSHLMPAAFESDPLTPPIRPADGGRPPHVAPCRPRPGRLKAKH